MSLRALVLSQGADRKVSGAIETLPVDRLPAGDVTDAILERGSHVALECTFVTWVEGRQVT